MRLPPDSLAHALSLAAVALGKLRQGTALPQAIDAVCQGQPAPVRGAVQDLAYRATRWLGSTDWLLRTLIPRPPAEGAANLLCVALAQLLDDPPPYTPFTVVNQTVRAASADPKLSHGKGMINGVLRRFLREQDELVAAMQADPVAATNYPKWWIDAVRSAYPDMWQAILAVGNRRPPMVLRVNPRRVAVDAYLARLAEAGIDAERIGEQAVRLARAVPVAELPGFAEGDVSVQDAGAQLAAMLLDVAPGQRVLDACAAPGGKTGHLLELADNLDVTALESDAARAVRINENLARLRQTAAICVGDAAKPDTWWDGRPFDRILADVPCSAAGIVRRHPDIRWLRRLADLKALATLQRDIVRALWACLKPGGKLVYVTCSIFPTEGEDQARWFESHLEDAIRLHAPGQLLPEWLPVAPDAVQASGFVQGASPVPLDHDGFFTRFSKNGPDAPTVVTVILRPSIRLLQSRFRQILQRLVVLGMLFLWWPVAAPAQTIEVNRAQLRYGDGGWNLSADFDFDLPSNLEDAVSKGIPLYFLVEFELIRPRWYWFDDHTISATRVVRLSYHPLTRQYRVSTGGLQVPFSRLKDAVDFMQHVRGWRVFEQRAVKAGETVQAEVRMRLDVTQLPKPFQINAVNTRDWNLSSEWKRFSLQVPETPPAPAPAPTAPPASAPTSPASSGSPGPSPNPGWGMSAGPSSAGPLLAPAK